MLSNTPARDVFVWASLVKGARYAPGDVVPDGAGAYLWAGDTFAAASDYILTGRAVAELGGHRVPLYLVDIEDGTARALTGPILSPAGDMIDAG